MDFKEIKNTKHYIYDNLDEFKVHRENIPVRHNWRHGEQGEWVFTDDGYVCQILRKLNISDKDNKKTICIRTLCGTFETKNKKKEMLGEEGIAENIYTFSGNNKWRKAFNERRRSTRELLFARYVASGIGTVQAYKLAFPDSKSSNYIKQRTDSLLKTETIQKMVSQEILALLEKNDATPEYIIERYKTIADLAERDTDKLGALRDLAKMAGLFNTEDKKSEQVTIWAGFSPEQLEGVKKHGKPEIIAHAEKEIEEKSS
jgi:outer membrane PBP1 activator LpoA protein|tara:strand:+ start:172 stop:948 length:777 start_codon:yes stop_codon:yes gene_type:complete